MAAQRSLPGQGDPVLLLLATPYRGTPGDVYSVADRGPIVSVVEDFAVCRWPVAVKIKSEVTQANAIRALRILLDELEGMPPHQYAGLWVKERQEREDYQQLLHPNPLSGPVAEEHQSSRADYLGDPDEGSTTP
jgi:hypothetical protein